MKIVLSHFNRLNGALQWSFNWTRSLRDALNSDIFHIDIQGNISKIIEQTIMKRHPLRGTNPVCHTTLFSRGEEGGGEGILMHLPQDQASKWTTFKTRFVRFINLFKPGAVTKYEVPR